VIYQAQGNLLEAARLLSEINWQTRNGNTFRVKIRQLTLERKHDDAARLLQARLARFNFGGRGRAEWHWADSEDNKRDNQLLLALTQRLAGDANGAKLLRNRRVTRWRSSTKTNQTIATLRCLCLKYIRLRTRLRRDRRMKLTEGNKHNEDGFFEFN
jgi:hypothetical protein